LVLAQYLVLVSGVGGREDDGAVAGREAVFLAGLGEDAHGVHGWPSAVTGTGAGVDGGVRLGPRQDLPALVVPLAPLPEHDGGAVVNAAVVLVAVEGVEAEAVVVHHADAAEPLAHVLALRPQHRRVLIRRVERHQLHLHTQRDIHPCRQVNSRSIKIIHRMCMRVLD
jgi:hypothetical protein